MFKVRLPKGWPVPNTFDLNVEVAKAEAPLRYVSVADNESDKITQYSVNGSTVVVEVCSFLLFRILVEFYLIFAYLS